MSKSLFSGKSIDKYVALAEEIQNNLTLSEKGDFVEIEKGAAFYNNLPEGITRDTVDALANYNNDFINASHIAMANVAAPHFEANGGAERVKAKVSIGPRNDSLFLSAEEQRSYGIPGTDKVSHKTMIITATEKIGGRGLPAVKTELSDQYADILRAQGRYLGV